MSEEELKQEIQEWSRPKKIRIGNVEVRDIFRERNSPLTLDSRELHQAFVESKRRTRNEPQGH